jgi:hypothetical protein
MAGNRKGSQVSNVKGFVQTWIGSVEPMAVQHLIQDSLAWKNEPVQCRGMRTIPFAGSLLVSTLFGIGLCNAAGRAELLRYRVADVATNVYQVEIEMRGENGTEILAGNLGAFARVVSSNAFALGLRGTLTPKREAGPSSRPMYGGMYRPSLPISLSEGTEVQFDSLGRILRVAGDYPLAFPLGSIGQVFIEPFAAKAASRWETTEELAVLDDPINLGPALSFMPSQTYGMSHWRGPSMGAGNQIGMVPVTRRSVYEIKAATPAAVTIGKHMSFESALQFGKEARISGSSDGEFVFDRARGLMRSAEMQGKAVVNTETVTRRTTVSLRLKLLEGAELENILKPSTVVQASQPPKKLNAEEVRGLMADLKSNDASTRNSAAMKLQTSEISEPPADLVEWAVEGVNEQESSHRIAAVKVLSDWGTAEHVPLLLKLLKEEELFGRHNVIRGLGRLKDKRAAEPLARLIATGGSDVYIAVEALGKIGPDAEDDVLMLLKEKHNDTRRSACGVLRKIGTKKSVEPLRELMLSTDRMLSDAATEAARAIMARE